MMAKGSSKGSSKGWLVVGLGLCLLGCGGLFGVEDLPPPEVSSAPAEEPEPTDEKVGKRPIRTVRADVHEADAPWQTDEEPQGCCGRPLQGLSASSTLAPQGSATYGVDHLGDDDLGTAWVEGDEGDGAGAVLRFTWGGDPPGPACDQLIVYNGYTKSEAAWKANGRVKQLAVRVDGERRFRIALADSWHEQTAELPGIEVGQQVELEILAVYPGAEHEDTALSELFQLCAM
jgi:hypothetical protein